ncbi:cytochrome P450 9e2-like [Pseudomyrmex gracilis]|uniref:cytochrome P450 9e2-like n=1 Tax=Pseudomyrmex gracilis TaxID=219809 RepID=UPI000994F750|nr:cytochrome P450 9e2-like [Pseudomyrmex gracilis]
METSTLILSILAAGICLYYFALSKLSHFKKMGILHERPLPFLGNMTSVILQRTAIMIKIQRLYNLFPRTKYFGLYDLMTPVIVIRDPDLINTIAIKNFDNFCDHRAFLNEELDPLVSKNLFNIRGDHWREMRKLLSPTFTSSKMKIMFKLMVQCAENLSTHVANESGETGKTYDVKDLLSRYANDVVATCAFGISVNSFKDKNNEFFLLGKEAMNFDSSLSTKMFINRNCPKLSKYLRLKVFSSKVENFFKSIVTETVKVRDEKGIHRPDMIQLMMETRNKSDGPLFDINEMTAQAFVFFLAGFDSVSTAMCFFVHEVGANPDVQRKLKEEIDDVLRETNGKPTYEAINGMKYLDAAFNETLRLYPLAAFLDRICVKEYELPPATPDAKPIKVKPGQSIWFPSYALHRDSTYYPNPDKFDPDRFLNGEVDNSVYIPFGIGPRICIGNRFAIMEAKIMMFYLLWHCELEPDVKTVIPMVLNKRTFIMMAEGGFWMKIRARKPMASVTSNGEN